MPFVEAGRVADEVPLTDEGRLVPGGAEQLGERRLRAVEAAVGIVVEAVQVGILPGEDRCPARPAQRVGHETAVKTHPFRRQTVDVRCPVAHHTAAEVTEKAVYGLPELNADKLAGASVVANPGCYATTIILALAPIVRAQLANLDKGIVADAKSGVSGAGKKPTSRTHFVSVADNLSAYSVFAHRHLGEIAEQLQIDADDITFTPHLLPIPRGILSTIYVQFNRPMQAAEVQDCYQSFYRSKPFVRVFSSPRLPEIQFSLNTNYCDLGFCLAPDGRRLVIVSCEDNLIKGAAGQAVQNMNVMHGWQEEEGLL